MITLSSKSLVQNLLSDVQRRVRELEARKGRVPKLAVVLVGDDPASVIYTTRKGDMATQVGMSHETLKFGASAEPREVKATIDRLNADPTVDGILIQRPLPRQFDERSVLLWVSPDKDVDAFHPENVGRLHLGMPCFEACTPAGVIALLRHFEIPITGKTACVIGRSNIVGKPVAAMLLRENATVLQCHSQTRNMRELTNQADILVVAAGKPALIDESYVKPGAVVIDVGIHRTPEGKVIGDVAFEKVAPRCSAITPVPGGVGPMTIAMLLANTMTSAERRLLG